MTDYPQGRLPDRATDDWGESHTPAYHSAPDTGTAAVWALVVIGVASFILGVLVVVVAGMVFG